MNMLPSSNQPQNVRAEIVQNAPREMSIGMVLQSIWRHRFFMLVWLALVVGLSSLVIFNLQASYRSTALVALDTRQIRFTEVSATLANPSAPMDSNVVRTEVEILNSDAVAREVVKDLDLVNDPEFLPQPSLLTRITSRIPFLATILPAAEEEKPVDADTRLAQVVNAYRNRLTVFNDGRSYVISVSFEASTPADAARIANRHAEVYIARQRAVKDQALASATSWLDREVATLSDRLSQSERAIQAYRERNGLLSLGGGAGSGSRAGSTLAQQQLADVAAQLAQARADLASREARLRQSRDPSTAGSVTEVVNSDALSRLRDAEVQARARLAEVAGQAGANHPTAQPLRAQIAEIQRMIGTEQARIQRSLANEATIARTRVAELTQTVQNLQSQLATSERSGAELMGLEREASATRALYESLLSRQKQVATQVGIQQADAILTSRATPALFPAFPNKKMFLGVAILVAVATGAMVALLLDRRRKGFETVEETEAEIGVPVLAALPRPARRNMTLANEVADHPRSIGAEAVRTLRSMLATREGGIPPVLAVTSSLPAEGKTSVALSLARSLASSGFQVLLIEADFRRGNLARTLFKKPVDVGAIAVLEQRVSLVQATREDPSSPLHVLASEGTNATPQDLLEPSRLRPLIVAARSTYDYVIVDTPPVAAVSDALLIGRSVDETLLVVRAGSTPSAAVAATVKAFRTARLPIAGFVLNATDPKRTGPTGYPSTQLSLSYLNG